MKLLFVGAGVLGSLYAARLGEAGHEISVLARGKRLQEIRSQGIVLEHTFSGTWILLVLGLMFHPKSGFLNFKKSANLRYSEFITTTRIQE